jgi:hypothetical protein
MELWYSIDGCIKSHPPSPKFVENMKIIGKINKVKHNN